MDSQCMIQDVDFTNSSVHVFLYVELRLAFDLPQCLVSHCKPFVYIPLSNYRYISILPLV